MKIIVIAINKYKEKDAIIDALSEDGKISFSVKGFFSINNKNVALNNPLTFADVDFIEGNHKYKILHYSKILDTPLIKCNSLDGMSLILLVSELVKNVVSDEESIRAYDILKDFIKDFSDVDDCNLYLNTLICISKILSIVGLEFEVNSCVNCGSKHNIVTFSFDEGGFLCKNCLGMSKFLNLSGNQMLLLRDIVNAKNFNISSKYAKKGDLVVILTDFISFIRNNFNINLTIDHLK